MQSATSAHFEARSKQQALDWSLVLISQGIESVLDHRAEDGVWLLCVSDEESARARDILRLYERENSSAWRREWKWTGLLFDARSLFIFLLFIALFAVGETMRPALKTSGMVLPAALSQGEWWRLFTAVTLHADVAHLASNVATGIVFLGLAMGAYSAGTGLLASFLAGAAANGLAFWLRSEPAGALGASGAIMGALGLLAVHSVRFDRHQPLREWLGRSVLAACLLLVLLGFNPDPKTDVLAHVLGFAVGCVLGLGLCIPAVRRLRTRWLDRVTGILCAILTLLVWGLALWPAQ
jgi:membrane associated rhomboid family serine protease